MNNSNMLDWNRSSNASAFTPIHGNLALHQSPLAGHFPHPNYVGQGNFAFNYSPMADVNAYPNYFNNQQLLLPNPMQHELYSPLIPTDAVPTSGMISGNISTSTVPDMSMTSTMSTLQDFGGSNSTLTLNDFLQTPEVGQEITLPMMTSTMPSSENSPNSSTTCPNTAT